MHLLAGILLISLVVAATAEWKCGARPEQNAATEKLIGFFCPYRRVKINTCCREHDACYRKKTGREPCDNEFERCTVEAASGTLCIPVVKTFSSLVRAFGFISYKGMW